MIYLLIICPNIALRMYFGWPKIRLSELPEYQKRLSGGGLIFSYVLLLIGSSFFYILVLRGKGQLGINHVSASSAMVNDNVFESNKTTSIIQLSSQEEEELQKMENERCMLRLMQLISHL